MENQGIFGGAANVHKAGAGALQNIMQNGTMTTKMTNAFGQVIDYKLPSGFGARFSAETGDFIGFLVRGIVVSYQEMIENAKLISGIESTTTTGDVAYSGTALEIADNEGRDLFHLVVDSNGEIQALFFAQAENYRIPLDLLERILAKAREVVKKVEQ